MPSGGDLSVQITINGPEVYTHTPLHYLSLLSSDITIQSLYIFTHSLMAILAMTLWLTHSLKTECTTVSLWGALCAVATREPSLSISTVETVQHLYVQGGGGRGRGVKRAHDYTDSHSM